MSLTSIQLAQRLTRSLTVRDVSELPVDELARLQDALNAGWNSYLSLLPAGRKENPRAELLAAPLTRDVTLTDGARAFTYVLGSGAFPVGSYAAESDLYGHSVQLPGDARLNRLRAAGSLLAPYLGSGGTVTATFYGDALRLGTDQQRLIHPPLWRAESSSHPCPLLRLTHQNAPAGWESYPGQLPVLASGEPRYWWTESFPASGQDAAPSWMIRLWPLPPARGILSFTVSALPDAFSLEDFITPRTLPVPDRELPHLLALCEPHLILSPLWRADADKAAVASAPSAAMKALRDLIPDSFDSQPNAAGTPHGF